ncbi:hypothetical protein NHP200010_14370 [Helicobacter bizzozeronii]|nr:hypothetical protein NHP200010_14370 [Helicobacter bizzozeronii]
MLEKLANPLLDVVYEFFGRNWDHAQIERRTQKALNHQKILVKNIPYGSGLAGGVKNARWYQRNRENILEYQAWVERWGRAGFCDGV